MSTVYLHHELAVRFLHPGAELLADMDGPVRVSPLCLGGMSLGDQWTGFMGTGMNAEKSEEFLDAY